MRKFHQLISFFLILAVAALVLGLLSMNRPQEQTQTDASAREHTDVTHNFLLCI